MQNYPVFLLLIKTDDDRFFALFVHSKFQNTKSINSRAGKDEKSDKLTNK